MHYIRSSYLTPHILVLLTGFEPVLAGFEIHFLYLIGIQEHRYCYLKYKK